MEGAKLTESPQALSGSMLQCSFCSGTLWSTRMEPSNLNIIRIITPGPVQVVVVVVTIAVVVGIVKAVVVVVVVAAAAIIVVTTVQ